MPPPALPAEFAALLPRPNAVPKLPPEFAALLPEPTAPSAPPSPTWGRLAFGRAVDRKPGPNATFNALVTGPLETSLHMLSGTGAQVAGGLAGLADAGLRLFDSGAPQPADVVQRVENALTYSPRTRAGQMATHALQLPLAEVGRLANWTGGKVSDLTGSPALGAAVNTGIQGLPLMLGAKLPALGDAPVEPDVSPEVASARDAGIKLTPNQAQVPGGIVGRTLESLAGHAKLERALSRANAEAVTAGAAREIGVEGPVTRAALQGAKAPANAVYAELSRLGNVPVDDAFRQQIAGIRNPGAGSFAFDTPADIARLKEGYGAMQNFDAGDAVEKVRQLRSDANTNMGTRYNPVQQALGHAQRAVADAIEGQLERHVAATGGPSDLLERYRAARVQLAKINTVEQALKAGKGQSVSALNLGKQLDRGAPLSGDLRSIAEAAQHFPRALQDLSKIRDAGPFSNLDFKLEGGLGLLKPIAALKALPVLAAQPLMRAFLGSDLYQDAAFGGRPYVPPGELRLGARALPTVAAERSRAPSGFAHLLTGALPHAPSGLARVLPLLAMGAMGPAGMAAPPVLSPIEKLLRGLHGAAGERGGVRP